MSTTARELIASINGKEVGILRDEGSIWSFEYAPEWVSSADAFDLAPNLPRATGKVLDGGSNRPVQWFFDNLLPEEKAREVLAGEAKIHSTDAFGLLAFYGKESAGAITLRNRGESWDESGYLPLTDAELHDRIAKLPRQSLAAGAPKHMSNAGAQHKLAVCIRDGKLFHPVGNTPSTHLLKPNHVDPHNWPNTVANEYFVMRLAARLGLDVPSDPRHGFAAWASHASHAVIFRSIAGRLKESRPTGHSPSKQLDGVDIQRPSDASRALQLLYRRKPRIQKMVQAGAVRALDEKLRVIAARAL
jgi:HipA-like protein